MSFIAFVCFVLSTLTSVVDGRLRLMSPPMGWNSWNFIGCNEALLNETTIHEVADALVSTGLAAKGYKYVNLDDCWMTKGARVKGQPLEGDKKRFPSGMKALGDYIHSKGLKFGIYQDVGHRTCAGDPGIDGNEELDAKTFAEWGVDYLKEDGCALETAKMEERYTTMSKALIKNEKPDTPIVYSCSWPFFAIRAPRAQPAILPEDFDWEAILKICDTWRLYDDVTAEYSAIKKQVDFWTKHQDVMIRVGKRGAYFDMDMLELGNGLTHDEGKTQLAFIALWATPLLIGADVRNLSKGDLTLLMNDDVIAVHQAQLGKPGGCHMNNKQWAGCARPLDNMSNAIILFNKGEKPSLPNIHLGLPCPTVVRDLYAQKTLGTFKKTFTFDTVIPPHGVGFYKFTFKPEKDQKVSHDDIIFTQHNLREHKAIE